MGLAVGCAGHSQFNQHNGFKSDIRPVIQLGHSGVVNAVAISPDDRVIVSGSADGTLKFWEVSTGRLIYTSYHHLEGRTVSAFRGGENEYSNITLSPQINCVDISADGRLVLSGSSDGKAVVTEFRTGGMIRVYRRHSKSVNAAVFSRDANLAASGGADGEIHLWQISTGRTIRNFRISSNAAQITALDISPDGRMILAGNSEGNLWLIDPETENSIQILGHHSPGISAAKFAPNGRMVVSGSSEGSLKLWDIHPRRELKSPRGHNSKVITAEFNLTSDRILSCAADGTVRMWNTESNLIKTSRIAHSADVHAAAFSSDERFIITGSRDQTLKKAWISSGRIINSFEGRSSRIHSVVFSPDGRLLLSSMRGQVNCWDLTTGRLKRIFKASLYQEDPKKDFSDSHPLSMSLNSVGFSPDGRLVVYLGSDGTYHTWDIETGKEVKTTKQYATKLSTVAYSPDKNYYARGTRLIHIRNTGNDRITSTLDGHKKWITALAYSPDGRSILSGDAGGNLILWNIMLGYQAAKLSGHTAAVTSIDFSRTGRFVATGSWDNSCRIWDIASGREIVKLVASPDGEWITASPEGFYINSPEGHNLIHWSVPGELETYSFEQFESEFKRPEIITEMLSWNRDVNLIAPDIARPPQIEIEGQNEIEIISEKQFPLQVKTQDTEKIQTLRIFLNGKPIHEFPVKQNQAEYTLPVPLVFGVNRITAVAYDKRGFSSNPKFIDVVSKNPELQRPNLHVYAVGISRYAHMKAEWQLQFAHTDARAIIESFKSQEGKMFGSVSSTLLVNEEATADAILENLCAFEEKDKVDIFVIFMAGHGVKTNEGDYYFLGHNGTFDNPQRDGLNWRRLKECLSRVKGRGTLFLDACHSGSIVNETIVPNDEMAHQFFAGERAGVMVFTASKGRQSAMESPSTGGGFGLFTWALTQGIGSRANEADTNGNRVVEFMELVNFVERYVSELTNGAQTPWLSRKELFGDLPIAAVE